MKYAIAIASLLLGCGASGQSDEPLPEPMSPVLDPAELIGNWCRGDLCLKIERSGYGSDWLTYSWRSDSCLEGGFIQQDASGALLFGAIAAARGCFAYLSEQRYTGIFYARPGALTVQLSVIAQPLELVAE